MSTEMSLSKECKDFRSQLPDMLLEEGYVAAHPELSVHMAACLPCKAELAEMHGTFAVLDEFQAPDPSPYFDTRLHARLREAQAAAPESLWERMRSYLQFSTGRSFRPAVAGALATVLVLGGGGTLLQMHKLSTAPAESRTVNDLRVLNNNLEAEQQMGPLLDQSGAEDGDAESTT